MAEMLSNIIENIPSLKGKVQASLISDKDLALRSKKLATLYTDVELPFSVSDTVFVEPSKQALRAFYEPQYFSFYSHIQSNELHSPLYKDCSLPFLFSLLLCHQDLFQSFQW